MTVRAIVAGHGTFAVGIVSAVEQITGRGDRFATISNSGLGMDDIKQSIQCALDASGARVIFTDLPAGSCTMAARYVMRAQPELLLVTGVNLSLLLDFAMQEDADPAIAVRTALDRGRASMLAFGAVANGV